MELEGRRFSADDAELQLARGRAGLSNMPAIPGNVGIHPQLHERTGNPVGRPPGSSIRAQLLRLLGESSGEQDEQGRPILWSERIARALFVRAAAGAVDAAKLVLEQTDGPMAQQVDLDWQVTITYVQAPPPGDQPPIVLEAQ